MKFDLIVLDRADYIKSKIKKLIMVGGGDLLDDIYLGVHDLIASKELFSKNNHYVRNGQMHLIVNIRIVPPMNSNDNIPPQKTINQDPFDEVFKVMTSKADMITLRTSDGKELKAFKKLVAKKSIVLSRMFKTDMIEKSSGVVNIIDFSGKVMEELLKFIYVGKVDSIERIDMELYDAAKVYQIDGLQKICLMSITYRMNFFNLTEILIFADFHDEHDLYNLCLEQVYR